MTRTIVVDDDDPTIEEDWRIFFLLWGHLIEFPISFPFRQGATAVQFRSITLIQLLLPTYLSLSPFSCQDRNHNNNIKNGSDRILCLSILAPKCCIKYSGLSMQHTLVKKYIKKFQLGNLTMYLAQFSSIGTLQTPFEFCSSKPRISIIPKY